MTNLGVKIKEARKKKGLSQEELAELSKVNLRTIQRIENNQNEPRGKTLHLICDVLEINAENILDHGKAESEKDLAYIHLSVLAFHFIPLGNILLPLIIWLNKKDKVIGMKELGANILNYQIIWSFVVSSSIIGFAVLKILHIPYLYIAGITVILYFANLLFPILFAYKVHKGKKPNRYPTIIRFIR